MDPSIAQIPTQTTSKLKSQLSHFLLFRHPIHQLLIYHQARILILTQIFQFFISQFNNSDVETPDNSQTPNHPPLPIPRPTLQPFQNPPFDPFKPIIQPHPSPLLLMLAN